MTLFRQSVRLLLFSLLLTLMSPCQAKIFYSKNEAMVLAFGQDASVEMLSLFPTQQQIGAIEKLARVKMDSSLFSFYVGKKEGKVQGYAAIETRTVRTKPETLLVVLTPEGALRNIYTLAFHEPPEYQPPERWYEQMYGRPIEQLDFNAGIQGISGATLSTRSALNSTRKVMAIYQIMLKERRD
ncbi:MAG: FMN-binding protein [Gammaproteobacteria bacterium]